MKFISSTINYNYKNKQNCEMHKRITYNIVKHRESYLTERGERESVCVCVDDSDNAQER